MDHGNKTKAHLKSELAEAKRRIAELEQLLQHQKEIEQTLTKSEERYREFIENISDECYETDLAGNITYVNEIGAFRSGYKREEIIGMNNRQYTRPEEAKRIFRIFNEIYRTGKPAIIHHYEQFSRNGQSRFVEASVSLIRDAQGRPAGFRGVSREVTERKKYLDELERYRTFLENVEDACFEFDLHARCTFCNETTYRMLGYTREEYMSLHHRQRYPTKEQYDEIVRISNNVYLTGMPSKLFEADILCKDGSVITMEFVTSPIKDERGTVVGLRGIGRDVSERKRDRLELERYRDFMENIADGCFENDLKGTVTYTNEIGARRLGLAREEFIGMNNRQYSRPEEADRINKIFSEIYRTGKPAFIDAYELIRKDGSPLVIEMSASIIRDATGKPVGFRGTTRDITEKKKIQDALKASEVQYRFLTERMSDIVWTTDDKMLTTYVSPSIQTVLGYTQDELMAQEPGKMFMTAESCLHATEVMNRELARYEQDPHQTGRSVSFESACRHKSGNIVWLDVVVSFIRDDSGRVTGLHSVARNVTEQKQSAVEKEKLILELQEALSEVKKLSGMLPICAHCKKIRDDQGYWNQMESYISKHSEALFSHCICPECAAKIYPDYLRKKNR